MILPNEIYAHVLSATRLIIADMGDAPDASSLEERVHARLWTYVTHAVRELDPSSAAEAPSRDARSKPWQYVIRFVQVAPTGIQVIAETDPEIMQGTGHLPAIIAKYAEELHETLPGAGPAELSDEAVKKLIPQMRNNLGRQGTATLRISYLFAAGSFQCHAIISKPGA
jgi:hypothetical protein